MLEGAGPKLVLVSGQRYNASSSCHQEDLVACSFSRSSFRAATLDNATSMAENAGMSMSNSENSRDISATHSGCLIVRLYC